MERDSAQDEQKQTQQEGKAEAAAHHKATSTRKQGQLDENLGPADKRMKPSEFAEYDELLNELADRLKLARHPDPSQLLKAARLLLESRSVESRLSLSGAEHRMADDEVVDETQSGGTATDRRRGGERDETDRLDDDEIRTIKQSKFTLNDITLPKTLAPTQVCWSADTTRGGGDHNGPAAGELAQSEKDELWSALERSARALKLLYLDDQRQLQNQVNELISGIQSITANPKTDPRLLATGR